MGPGNSLIAIITGISIKCWYYRCLGKINTPPEKNTLGTFSMNNTKSGAGEQFLTGSHGQGLHERSVFFTDTGSISISISIAIILIVCIRISTCISTMQYVVCSVSIGNRVRVSASVSNTWQSNQSRTCAHRRHRHDTAANANANANANTNDDTDTSA